MFLYKIKNSFRKIIFLIILIILLPFLLPLIIMEYDFLDDAESPFHQLSDF